MIFGVAADVSWGWVVALAAMPVAASVFTTWINRTAETRRRSEDHARADRIRSEDFDRASIDRFAAERRDLYAAAFASCDEVLAALGSVDFKTANLIDLSDSRAAIATFQRSIASLDLLGGTEVQRRAAHASDQIRRWHLFLRGMRKLMQRNPGQNPLHGSSIRTNALKMYRLRVESAIHDLKRAARADLGLPVDLP